MKSLGMNFCMSGKLRKTDRGVDIVTQEFFSQRHITCQKAFNGIA